jgi:hypothetical protein
MEDIALRIEYNFRTRTGTVEFGPGAQYAVATVVDYFIDASDDKVETILIVQEPHADVVLRRPFGGPLLPRGDAA